MRRKRVQRARRKGNKEKYRSYKPYSSFPSKGSFTPEFRFNSRIPTNNRADPIHRATRADCAPASLPRKFILCQKLFPRFAAMGGSLVLPWLSFISPWNDRAAVPTEFQGHAPPEQSEQKGGMIVVCFRIKARVVE